MLVSEYMNRRCICGALRAAHYHAHDAQPDGRWIPTPATLRVLGGNGCRGFTDEIELELGGNPIENKHLGPLMREGD